MIGARDIVSVFGATPNPIPLLIIAYAVRRLPYIVRSTAAGLEQTSGELEEAAMNLGATRFRAVRSIHTGSLGSTLGSMSGMGEGDRPLVVAQLAAKKKILQAQPELVPVSIPPVHRDADDVDAVPPTELHRV